MLNVSPNKNKKVKLISIDYSLSQCIRMVAGDAIKIFQFNQNYCQTVGIALPESKRSHYTRNAVNLVLILSLVQFTIALAEYLLYDAKSMSEYGVTFFIIICIIDAIIDYLIILWKFEDILNYIKTCEAFIEKSKCRHI